MITKSKTDDIEEIVELYKATASNSTGLARSQNEITKSYVATFVDNKNNLSLIAIEQQKIIGELHAYRPQTNVFRHVLTDLTICIHPDHQGKKQGQNLFFEFFKLVNKEQEILRVELFCRESNTKAIKFYQNLGFNIEGIFKNRINGLSNLKENDIAMAWLKNTSP